MTSSDLRKKFLDYFADLDHTVLPSSPLIPQGDPSLLFTSAGMVPFKPYFLGLKRDLKRAATCQKSFRTTDIERVGHTIRHLTFFEMLGNFSFGDYFKAEAIDWAWTFLTDKMGLDPDKMHVSVYKDDDEALELWRKVNPPNPILKLDEDTNYWNMGPTGPCGPCSEIYWDRGREFSCSKPDCVPGCDCDRYLEIWNLVFTQFDRQEDGSLKPLPRKNIDTGLGFERLAMVVQKKQSPFETDLFRPVVEAAIGILSLSDIKKPEVERTLRVLADHSRAAAFLVAEGIMPSNEGRGYVLRRLIRRASGQGSNVSRKREPFVFQLAALAAKTMSEAYPELKRNMAAIEDTVREEENKFMETLETGEAKLKEIVQEHPIEVPGKEAFHLYETYGFPLDLTKEILASKGIHLDEAGFEWARTEAQETARKGWKGSGEKKAATYQGIAWKVPPTRFSGYDDLEAESRILALVDAEGREKDSAVVGEEIQIFLGETSFYAESGGQVGDKGEILDARGKKLAEVFDTQKTIEGLVIHRARAAVNIARGMRVTARVNRRLRRATTCHHTATHLLNEALRRVLGERVRQAGSLVAPDRLRFDYTCPKAPTEQDLRQVEKIVDQAISESLPVEIEEKATSEVERYKAVTIQGEEYGKKARFVLIGPRGWKNPMERFSLELCGGTHVRSTIEIRLFKIMKDSSVSAGTRRIEAVAGPAAANYFLMLDEMKRSVSQKLQVSPDQIEEKVGSLIKSLKEATREILNLKERLLSGGGASADQISREVRGEKLEALKVEDAEMKNLRSFSDRKKKDIGSGFVLISSAKGDRLSFTFSMTADLVSQGYDASKIMEGPAKKLEGKAGGRPDFAQGGVKSNWEDLVSEVYNSISSYPLPEKGKR